MDFRVLLKLEGQAIYWDSSVKNDIFEIVLNGFEQNMYFATKKTTHNTCFLRWFILIIDLFFLNEQPC